jgi:eukaryotic-like serine/threonine-protein kinase
MASSDSNGDQRIGTVISGRYVIESVLGQGGMGTVYRAIQRPIDRPVAIKLMAVGRGRDTGGQQIVQRFQREAAAMAKLKHPNTVRLIEFGVTDDDEMFLAMELLEGVDVSRYLGTEGAMPVGFALNIIKESLGSLAEAHALGILHRDIKPANIFLLRMHDGQMFAKLTDFGIAYLADGPGVSKLTVTGSVMGTPAYMAPEQAMGKPLDARSDLYSLGVTLFHMLTGRTPFETESMASQLVAHMTQAPPRLAEACPNRAFSPELQALLDALLSKQPEARPQTAQAALREVERLLRAEPSDHVGDAPPASGRWAGAAAKSGPHSHESTPQPVAVPKTMVATQEPSAARPALKRNTLPWVLAAAASCVSIATTYWLTRPSTPTQQVIDERHSAATVVRVPEAAPSQAEAEELPKGIDAPDQPVLPAGGPGGPGIPSTPSTQGERAPETRDATSRDGHDVTIRSLPVQARVFRDGTELGVTPYTLTVGQPLRLTLKAAEHKPLVLDLTADSQREVTAQLEPQPKAAPTAQPAQPPKAAPLAQQAPPPKAAPTVQQAPPPPAVAPLPPVAQWPKVEQQAQLAAVPPAPTQSALAPYRPPPAAAANPVQRLLYMPRNDRKQYMLQNWPPPFSNVSSAKSAYKARVIDEALLDDMVWVFKTRRKQLIQQEKLNYKQGLISKYEYGQRVDAIDRAYEGQ